ncbi:MAG TPA: hypothetical protein VNR00_05500 [Opitutus sp.]|nr:hypothetical protein [Opitutus sp.]
MQPIRVAALVLGIAGLANVSPAAGGWPELKAGMTAQETAAALGEPLMRSQGRQFELWIYDSGAEVVCLRGVVVAWTAPAGITAANGRELDLRGVPATAPEQKTARSRTVRTRPVRFRW